MKTLIKDAIKAGFRCDPKESKAVATVTKITTRKGVVYEISAAVEIRPYPNALKYGGYYMLGRDFQTPKERDEYLAYLKEEFELYKQIGMTNIEIREATPATQTAQLKMV